jgi:hypothetical protein
MDDVRLTASSSGVLKIVRGCVRVSAGQPSRLVTVLWHRGTELHRDQAGYFLRESYSGATYRFGERFEFGGGTASQDWIEREYPDVAKRCGPPYASGWLPD